MAHSKSIVALLAAAFIFSGCSFLSDTEEMLWPSLSGDDEEGQIAATEIPQEPVGGLPYVRERPPPPLSDAPPGYVPPGYVPPGAPLAQVPPQGPPGVAPPPPLGTTQFQPQPATPGKTTGTFVGGKIVQLRNDLGNLQAAISAHNTELQRIRVQTTQHSQSYHGLVAAVQFRLQVGTTPGNPVLTQQWNEAQKLIQLLGTDIANMNSLSNRAAADGAMIEFLLESTRSAYSLSGAIDEDHHQLAILEDNVGKTVVLIDRLLKELADDIRRQTEYVSRERKNLATLALAVKNGELYGTSLANLPFAPMAREGIPSPSALLGPGATPGLPATRRPLVVIRFERGDVDYQQALYGAVRRALERRPAAQFDLVAVTPAAGSPAQVALNSRASRRNAEGVLRALAEMGLPAERVKLSAMNSAEAQINEVHIYIR